MEIVVLDADGNPLPLASEEAVEVIVAGDPIWCPSGVAPKPGVGGCSPTKSSITELVTFYPTGFPSNGTIWVQYGAAVGGIIDGSGAWAARSIYSLTVQGGWEGTPGSTGLHNADPYSYFGGTDNYLMITNWGGSVTLKNLIFQNVNVYSSAHFNAVHIVSKGNIRLDKVQVNDTINDNLSFNGHGAMLNNTNGTGTVIVTNSSFNNNEGDGLLIYSNNIITLTNVSAYHNFFEGVALNNYTSVNAVSVSNSTFTDNGLNGLWASSKGSITLNNISANSNDLDGVALRNFYGSIAAPIYVNGVNTFNDNGSDGLYASSNGPIKVSNTTANMNLMGGVFLTNQASPFSVGVTISGYLNALRNIGDGLAIYSTGVVTAANLNSSLGSRGTYINNTFWCPPPSLTCIPKNVTITGTNVFNRNERIGLEVQSRGAVTLYNLTANDNGINSVEGGVEIHNDYDAGKQMPVTLIGNNVFLNNVLHGLHVESYGSVTLNNVTANNNGYWYSSFNQEFLHFQGYGVHVENSGGLYAKPVTIAGTNVFDYNDNSGLQVDSDGAITVSKVSANYNRNQGAQLTNAGPVQANVTISGYGVFEGNGFLGVEDGLKVTSHGAITLTNITATMNDGDGADLNTIGLIATHPVTLYGVNTFHKNGSGAGNGGLIINADGAITVYNITATDNYDFGAILDNYTNWANPLISLTPLAGFGSVKVNGYGTFFHNTVGDGLNVHTHGSITLNRVVADFSGFGGGGDGINLQAAGNITLICSSAYGNEGIGLLASTPGTLTLKGFLAYWNTGGNENLSGVGTLTPRTTCP
jgi:hypothetical protein